MAIAALVLGIIGLVLSFLYIGIVPAIIGLVFSIFILRKGKNGMAIAGLVCSILGILIALVMIVATPSKESGSSSGTIEDKKETVTEQKSDNLADKMQVKEYDCMYSDYRIVAFHITNTSDKDVRIELNITAKDSDGNALASSNPEDYTVASGSSTILSAWLENVDENATIDYTMNVSTDVRSPSAANNIDLKHNVNGDKVVLTATNNSDKTAYFLNVDAIFLKNGKMVGCGETYLVGNDSDIKAGETRSGEIDCYADGGFDDAIVAYTAEY